MATPPKAAYLLYRKQKSYNRTILSMKIEVVLWVG
jgi:hypothetical protein